MHALFIKITTKLAGAHFYPACMAGAKLACCMHASLTGHCRSCIMHASLTVTGKLQEKATSRWPGGPHIRETISAPCTNQSAMHEIENASMTGHVIAGMRGGSRKDRATSRWRGGPHIQVKGSQASFPSSSQLSAHTRPPQGGEVPWVLLKMA
ncbi:hypothetical protein V6N11_052062 [Hibiscus sabdariffa]|uniref:Uncharacterized protein n=1 Tax=Hibiscus sabdariffa TaxID=183260 RepID=A0ABR2U9G4_9ROSI